MKPSFHPELCQGWIIYPHQPPCVPYAYNPLEDICFITSCWNLQGVICRGTHLRFLKVPIYDDWPGCIGLGRTEHTGILGLIREDGFKMGKRADVFSYLNLPKIVKGCKLYPLQILNWKNCIRKVEFGERWSPTFTRNRWADLSTKTQGSPIPRVIFLRSQKWGQNDHGFWPQWDKNEFEEKKGIFSSLLI